MLVSIQFLDNLGNLTDTFLTSYSYTIQQIAAGEKVDLKRDGHFDKILSRTYRSSRKNGRLEFEGLNALLTKNSNGHGFDFFHKALNSMNITKEMEIRHGWYSYVSQLDLSLFKNLNYFNIKDLAHLNDGTNKRSLILIEGPGMSDEDDIILEAVQGILPASVDQNDSSFYIYSQRFQNHCDRMLKAYLNMGDFNDTHAGVMKTDSSGTFMIKTPLNSFNTLELDLLTNVVESTTIVEFLAKRLAFKHSGSGKTFEQKLIPHKFASGALKFFNSFPNYKSELNFIASKYKETIKKDFELFKKH